MQAKGIPQGSAQKEEEAGQAEGLTLTSLWATQLIPQPLDVRRTRRWRKTRGGGEGAGARKP